LALDIALAPSSTSRSPCPPLPHRLSSVLLVPRDSRNARRAAVPRADVCMRSLACVADQSPGDTGYVSCPCVQASRNDSSVLRCRAFAWCADAAVPMLPALHSCSCSQRCIAVLHDVASKPLLTIRTAFLVAERRLISRCWHRKDNGNDLRLEKNSAPTAFLCRCTPKIRVPTA
jgi:hypothetical protein